MPTYTYACRSCDHAFDIRQSFSDDPLLICPQCGEAQLRKVIHPVGISFKGSGFYRTDSKSDGKSGGRADGKTPSKSATSTESSSSTSSESSSSSSSGSSSSAAAPAASTAS